MFANGFRLPLAFVVLASSSFLAPLGAQAPAKMPAKSGQASHLDRALVAMSIARSAADADLMDVSFEAVRRAVGKGPPVAAVELGGLLGGRPRPNVSIGALGGSANPTSNSDVRFARELVAVSDLWAKRNADPEKCYLLFQEIVFPATRPNEAFLYTVDQLGQSISYGSVSLDMGAAPAAGKCGAQCLVEWASKCGKLADVRSLVETRSKMPGSASAAAAMRLFLGLQESASALEMDTALESISTQVATILTGRDGELVFSKAVELSRRLPADSPVVKTFHVAVLDSVKANNRWGQNRHVNPFLMAQLKLAINDDDRMRIESLMDMIRTQWAQIRSGNESYVASMESTLFNGIADYALGLDRKSMAFEYMKRGIDAAQVASGSGRTSSVSFVDIGNSIAKRLLEFSAEQRYELTKQLVWSLPLLGLQQHSTFMPVDGAPDLFGKDGDKKRDMLAAKGIRSTSLLQWHIRDAIACGKLDEVRAKIEALRVAKSDDAEVVEMVLALAQGQPLDASTRIDNSVPDKPTLKRIGLAGSEPMPIEIELALAAFRDDKTRVAGLNFVKQLVEVGTQVNSNENLAWARRVLFDAEQAARQEPAGARHTSLTHWTASADNRIASMLKTDLPESIWLERKPGMWGVVSGSPKEHLFLKYPLAGNFEIEVSGQDGPMQQSSLGFLGATFDFIPENNYLTLVTGFYQPVNYPCQSMKADAINKYRLKRTADSVELFVNDSTAKSLSIPRNQPLFFTFVANNYRVPTYGVPCITGTPTIPREMMLSEPQLLCWSASLKGQSLPRLDLVGDGGRNTSTKLSNGDVYYDYEFVNGEIQSINHHQLIAEAEKKGVPADFTAPVPPATLLYKDRREGWLFCIRPLLDGERIDLEFYQEKDKFTVAPTLGRLAMLLDKPKTELHWVTMDSNGEYFGIPSDNRQGDPNAEQLADVALKEKDWNQLSLKLDGGVVTLAINRQDVYRRKWETNFYHKFGIFHNPMQTHVRLRNVRLSGNWPDKLPENLMELNSEIGVVSPDK